MKKFPFVSILIVNYNGRHLLEDCLSSLQNISYPKNSYEVIVVDNNSSDDSVPFMQKHYPQVQVIRSDENLGFTGGNVLAYKHAKGEYLVLLNTDVRVDPSWLTALVQAASDQDIGVVSSRLRYFLPFVELTIDSAAVPKSKVFNTIDHSPIGVLIEDIVCEPSSISWLVNYKSGFYDRKLGEICTRRTSGKASVLLPFDPYRKENVYTITMHGLESTESLSIPVRLVINKNVHSELILQPYEAQQVVLRLHNEDVEGCLRWLVQNAGNIVLSDGYSKDRGSVIISRDTERREFYEEESSYFDNRTELLAACGASCLIKREVIDHVGFFDGYYFMYYEDVEFSLRAWRAGWKIFYEPESIGYHKHRATTGAEESAFFLSQVERNHLALVIAHFPKRTVIVQIFAFLLRFTETTVKYAVFQFMENEARANVWRMKFEGRKSALRYLTRSIVRLLKNRIDFDRYWPIDRLQMRKMMY